MWMLPLYLYVNQKSDDDDEHVCLLAYINPLLPANSVQHDFSAMLTAAFQDGDNGIPIRYRFDGKLFNLRSLQAKSKVQIEVLDEFLFAVDMAKGAPTEEKM